MRFRPCIDIHNGKVKQIVGGSLEDKGDQAAENFVSGKSAADYARLYRGAGLKGGHIIMLNPSTSDYYNATKAQAIAALKAYPGGMQVGGGIHPHNAGEFLDAGASHVIVTSYVFKDGVLNYDNLKKMVETVGKDRLVLDLSCRRRDGSYYIVTDRWQKFTQLELNPEVLEELSSYCDEFLIHAVDVEGKAQGIEKELAGLLGSWNKIPMTYAGGVADYSDLETLRETGHGKIDVTIGSALDLFGGILSYNKVLEMCDK